MIVHNGATRNLLGPLERWRRTRVGSRRDRGNALAAICDNTSVPRAVLCWGAITVIGLKQEALHD